MIDKDMLKIENDLYTEVMLLIESQYNLEGIINPNRKDSTKIVFKDKKDAIRAVAEAIERFSEENGLNPNLVKEYLIHIIESKIKLKGNFIEEYEEVREIILTDNEER